MLSFFQVDRGVSLEQSIQEWSKENLQNTAFENFILI